ncbi:hypothetical protein D9M70_360830 [compost metagenome]
MRAFLVVILLLLSGVASAATYSWKLGSTLYTPALSGSVYSSALAACEAVRDEFLRLYPERGPVTSFGVVFSSDTAASCKFKASSVDTRYLSYSSMSRLGDSCSEGATYNSTTGGCDAPPPNLGEKCSETPGPSGLVKIVSTSGECVDFPNADLPAQCKHLGSKPPRSTRMYISFTQDGTAEQPPNPEMFGCKIKVEEPSVQNCKLPAARSSNGVTLAPAQAALCTVTTTFTGDVADPAKPPIAAANPGSDKPGVCPDTGNCEAPDLPREKESQPCNYVLDGEGRKVCSSSNYEGEPGQRDCGYVNGSFDCYKRPAKSNGLQIATVVDTKTNSDGTKTTTKTDTATKSVCATGTINCKTSTTTTTTTTKTAADGTTTTSTSSQCVGPLCGTQSASNGSGGGGGGGDGDGEGSGCVTAEECSDGSSPGTPELAEVDDYQTTTQKFYDSMKASPIVAAVAAVDAPQVGVAPNLVTPSLAALGGVSLDFRIITDLVPVVRDVLSLVMKAFWCFVALMIFLMA